MKNLTYQSNPKSDFPTIHYHLKGSTDDFSAYDFEYTPETIAINTFIGHPDHDWDQRLQDRMISIITIQIELFKSDLFKSLMSRLLK